MEKFVQFHCHTSYSQLDAVNSPEQMVEQAVKHNHQAMAITDHGVMGGTLRHQNACLKVGIKPLIGMEAYVVQNLVDLNDKGKRTRMKNNHIILIAKNLDGWKSLLKLNYLSNSDDEHFYYKPRITFKELFENKKGLFVSSACLASPFANLLKLGREDEAVKMFETFCYEFGEDFAAEIQLNEIPEQKDYNNWLMSQAMHYGVPLIITGDCHYALPEGSEAQEMSFKIRKEEENEVGQTFACRKLYYHGIDDYKQFNKNWNYGYTDEQIENWCGNTVTLSEKIDFLIPPRTKMLLPRQCFDEDTELVNKAQEGLCDYFGVTNYADCPKEYRERLNFELQLMLRKGIARYFLTLTNILKWCDENNISRGPGRGSCFLPGTKVQGKNIEEYKKGDGIVTGVAKEKTTVGKVFCFDRDEEIIKLKTENGDEISCTKDHPFLVIKEKIIFVETKDLQIGDRLFSHNEDCKITEITKVPYKGKVYDLQVNSLDHTYTVESGYVVHNCGGSLVAMCLGITSKAIEPIANQLLFERFISQERLTDCIINYSKKAN